MAQALSCPVWQACGGCPSLNQPLVEQGRRKLHDLLEVLQAQGIAAPTPQLFQPSGAAGYRNRLRLAVDAAGAVCFFNQEKSIECLVLEPRLSEAIRWLKLRGPIGELRGAGHVELRVSDADERVGLCVYFKGEPPEAMAAGPLPSAQITLWEERAEAIQACLPADWVLGLVVAGELCELPKSALRLTRGAGAPGSDLVFEHDFPCLKYACGALDSPPGEAAEPRAAGSGSYEVPLDGFVQVNSKTSRALVGRIKELAFEHEVLSFIDLFCGAGNFSLPLARAGLTGISVEQTRSSVLVLGSAARREGLPLTLYTGDARALPEQFSAADLVIANPPRAGLREGAALVSLLAQRYVALCSCNLASLARDLQQLIGDGLRLERLELFDMFPHTQHAEVLAWLSADGAR